MGLPYVGAIAKTPSVYSQYALCHSSIEGTRCYDINAVKNPSIGLLLLRVFHGGNALRFWVDFAEYG